MISKSLSLALIVLLLLTADIFGGQTGKISGIIKDKKTGEPLVGVNVALEHTSMGAATDINGYYVILNVFPGDYTINISMVGYRKVKIQGVVVTADKTTPINIQLEQESVGLKEIVVTAKKPVIDRDLTSSELTVTSKDIKNLPVESLTDVLNLKAGVITDASGGIHIRGGRASEVGYLVDGIPVTDNYSGSQGSTVDVQFLQEVKVISGVFNAEYGQAMSGIVDLITKRGEDHFEGNINVSTGDYLSQANNIFLGINRFNPIGVSDIKADLAGPIKIFGKRISYDIAARRFGNEGWLFGQRRFNPTDSSWSTNNIYHIQATGDNKIVSLNSFLNYNFQTKLNIDATGSLKLSDLFLYDNTTSQTYNHLFKYDPNGEPTNYEQSFNNIFSITYLFSSRTYLTLKHSFKRSILQTYVYPNINDPRYADPQLLKQLTSFSFLTGGTDMVHDKRISDVNTIKLDIVSQLDEINEFKTGAELDLNVINLDNKTALYHDTTTIFDFNSFLNDGKFVDKPLSFAYYIQDKIEYKSIIINAGIRYDYFNSFGDIPTDPRDPANSPKIKAKPQYQFSPRLGIAFPISAEGTIHFSYGHFFQVPPFEYMYANPTFKVGPGGLYTLMGNANLKAQSTVAYELGINYVFSNLIGLEVIGYHKDFTNLLSTQILNTYISSDRYALYTNMDYGQAKGITISLFKQSTDKDHFSVSLDYTLQVAEGNASDPNDAFNKAQGNPPQKPNIQVVPLNWDQTHTINLSLSYNIPNDLNLGITAKYGSGMPYTPTIQSQTASIENSARMPSQTNVDLQFNKYISFGNFAFQLFVRVFNLFDERNEINVYTDTGRATYSLASHYNPENQGANTLSEFLIRPDFYSEPRRVLIGLSYNLPF